MRTGPKNKDLAATTKCALSSKVALSAALLILLSCAKHFDSSSAPASSDVPQPSTAVPAQDLMSFIEGQLLPEDLKNFSNRFTDYCPLYNSLDQEAQKKSIASFATAIAHAESNLNSFTVFYETALGFDSMGLFSLSYVDHKNYGCDFSSEEDNKLGEANKTIFQTDRQVDCFLKISRKILTKPEKFSYLRNLAKKEKSVAVNPNYLNVKQKMSVYWSVLRHKSNRLKEFKKMRDKTIPLACQD